MAKREGDWFDEWSVIPWGIGGDEWALRCPRANSDRPDRTPACYIDLEARITIGEMRVLAADHRRTAHQH